MTLQDTIRRILREEVAEYARTLKNARRQGSGLRFPKSAIKANPNRFRPYSREQVDESLHKVKHFYGFLGLPNYWVDDNDKSYSEKYFNDKEYEDKIFDNFFDMDKEFGHKNSLFGTRGLEPGNQNRTSKSFNEYVERFGPMIVRILKKENIQESTKKITCKCGWSWKLKDGGNDPYTCHKCGHNNSKKYIKEEKEELLNESKFFRRRIDLDEFERLLPLHAQQVFYETASYEQFKYELTLRAVESVLWNEYQLGWEDLPSEDEIKFVSEVSDMFESIIKELYKSHS